MIERNEKIVTTLEERGADGGRYLARIESRVVTIEIRTVETYTTVQIPAAQLEAFSRFIDAVRVDPSAAVAESTPGAEEPEEEGQTNG